MPRHHAIMSEHWIPKRKAEYALCDRVACRQYTTRPPWPSFPANTRITCTCSHIDTPIVHNCRKPTPKPIVPRQQCKTRSAHHWPHVKPGKALATLLGSFFSSCNCTHNIRSGRCFPVSPQKLQGKVHKKTLPRLAWVPFASSNLHAKEQQQPWQQTCNAAFAPCPL